jgi:hypothetical protein
VATAAESEENTNKEEATDAWAQGDSGTTEKERSGCAAPILGRRNERPRREEKEVERRWVGCRIPEREG